MSTLSDVFDGALGALKTVAPTIATAIGGPLAGTAVNAIIGAFGLPADTAPPVVAQAVVSATPDQLLALKNAENAFALSMRQLDIHLEDLAAADKTNARAQTVDLAKAGSAIAWGAPVVSVVVLASFGAALYAILGNAVPPGSADVANVMLGTLGGMASSVVAYWVGSSNGSIAKTTMLYHSTPASPK